MKHENKSAGDSLLIKFSLILKKKKKYSKKGILFPFWLWDTIMSKCDAWSYLALLRPWRELYQVSNYHAENKNSKKNLCCWWCYGAAELTNSGNTVPLDFVMREYIYHLSQWSLFFFSFFQLQLSELICLHCPTLSFTTLWGCIEDTEEAAENSSGFPIHKASKWQSQSFQPVKFTH